LAERVKPEDTSREVKMKTQRKDFSADSFKGFVVVLAIFGLIWVVSGQFSLRGETSEASQFEETQNGNVEPWQFSVEGVNISPLLEGLGSVELVAEIQGLGLNCAALVLDEEFTGDRMSLTVEFECECIDLEKEETLAGKYY
jgi:hypothetical protein